jgi:hypothetical protein
VFKLFEVFTPGGRITGRERIAEMEHEVGCAVGGQRIERVARVTRENEIRLIGQDTGVADDPRNGIRDQARASGEPAKGKKVSSFD